MLAASYVTTSVLIIDCVFAVVMIAIGFAAAWWLFHVRKSPNDEVDTERAMAALTKIRALATSVAEDVGAHTTRVQEISSELNQAANKPDVELDQIVLSTVAEMVEANERLHTQLASAEQKLQQQAEEIQLHAAVARTDALTGLANRRVFDDELNRRFVEWKRMQTPYSLFILDVDHFKNFNDVHGHMAGDAVLRGVAKTLAGAMREMDTVCRYGGEEFAVIMPATDATVAKQAAERARSAIEAARFDFEKTNFNVTASVGLAEVQVGEDNKMLIKRADDALYAAKSSGRNQAHFHDGVNVTRISNDAPSEEAEQTSNVPTLDKLATREVFFSELQRRVAEGVRFRVPLSLVLLHIDDYKSFSAQYGAEAGDLVLDTVAQYLEILLRDMDLLAKYKPGTFAILLPGSSHDHTLRVMERIHVTLSSCVIPIGETRHQLSVRFGVTTVLPEVRPNDTPERMLRRAEQALEQSYSAQGERDEKKTLAYINDGHSCGPLQFETTDESAAHVQAD